MTHKTFKYEKPFHLESGKQLPELEIAYNTFGDKNNKRVIWICHALTANSDPSEWWNKLVGKERYFNPKDYFIVCANILGSCYGTTGPLSINPETGKAWYRSFPQISTRDIAKVHSLLANYLKIDKIHTLIGASVGGHQAIEWAICENEKIENLILIATNAQFTPWGIALNASQRMAIETDYTFYDDNPTGGLKGLSVARSIALLSYRNAQVYNNTQREESLEKIDHYKADSYQKYQGEKLAKRFNAYSYYILSKALDSHNIGRKRKSIEDALKRIKAKSLIIAIPEDLIFSTKEQKHMAKYIPNATYKEIKSNFGHDGFLIESEQLINIINNFYSN